MADINIVTSVAISLRGVRSVVFVSPTVGYLFYTDANSDFVYKKTVDGGATWAAPVALSGAETIVSFDVWYDQWTPRDTGRLIHIWYFGVTNDRIIWRSLNTVNDSLLAEVTVFQGASAVAGRGAFVSGAKMRGGNLLCCFDIDAGAEHGTYRSVNNGTSWASRTDVVEATLDHAWVFPGMDADPQDAVIMYHDDSASEFTIKTHDDSANTNAESGALATVVPGITDLTGQHHWTGAIRHSDGHLLVALWTERDTANGDLRCWDVSGSGIGQTVEKSFILTNKDDSYYPSMFIDQRTGNVYLAYVGKSDGSETLDTTASVYYAKSVDGMASWTMDTLYSATGSDWRGCWVPLMGPRFLAVWQDISSLALMTNTDKSLEFAGILPNNYQFVKSGDGMCVSESIR